MPKGAQMGRSSAPWVPKGAQMGGSGTTWVPKGAQMGCSGTTWVPKSAHMGTSGAIWAARARFKATQSLQNARKHIQRNLFEKAVTASPNPAPLHSVPLYNEDVYPRVHTSIYIYIYIYTSVNPRIYILGVQWNRVEWDRVV